MNFETLSMLLGGIALFLFGMTLFEETISSILGGSIKDSIQKFAGGLWKNIAIGIFSTAILQSSTVVSMIMLGFVGAGILTLTQGIGVVLGANIGTTFTSWMVALVGFKFNIEAITLPIIAVGGFCMIFGSRYPKLVTIGKFMIGFGLLFLGLGYMKESVDGLATIFSLDDAMMNLGMTVGIGILMTIILQTSSGASAIVLTALSAHMITFDIALGIIIGANMGTAVSTFIVSFLSNTGKQRTKKLVAFSHVLANFIIMIVVIVLLNPLLALLNMTHLPLTEPLIAIALFNTLYKSIGVIGISFFVPSYVRFIQKRKLDEHIDMTLFRIEQVSTTMPEEYVVAMKQDVIDFGEEIVDLIRTMAHHTEPTDMVLSKYAHIKNDCEEWMTKVLQYDIAQCNPEQQQRIEQYQLSVINFLSAIKQLKDISGHYYYLRDSSSTGIHAYMDQFDEKLEHLADIVYYVIHHKSESAIHKIAEGEKVLILDDVRFLKDIKNSITTHHDDTENNHYRSQLLKTNRSVVVATKSLLEGLIEFHRLQN